MENNILIADDLSRNRDLIKIIIKNKLSNINFFEAKDGNEAFKIITNNDIDLIILDLVMPNKTGYELLKDLKRNNKYKDIPVIVHSGVNNMDIIKETLEEGALDYFTKPFTPEEMQIIVPLKVKNALDFYKHKKELILKNEQTKEDLKLAVVLQNSLMASFKDYDNIEMYGKYIPSTLLGGDIYDTVQVDKKFWFLISDVIGHGVTASMISFMIKAMFNHSIHHYDKPKDILEDINSTFCNMMGTDNNLIVTAFIGLIEDDTCYYANAGHPYPIYFDSEKNEVNLIKQNGILIGFDKNIKYTQNHTKINSNDVILTYTDGLYELNEKISTLDDIYNFSIDNIKTLKNDPHKFIDDLINTFRENNNNNFYDDVTTMLIKVK